MCGEEEEYGLKHIIKRADSSFLQETNKAAAVMYVRADTQSSKQKEDIIELTIILKRGMWEPRVVSLSRPGFGECTVHQVVGLTGGPQQCCKIVLY